MKLLTFIAILLTSASLFAAETFLVDGRKAVIHPADKPAEGKPWLWYAPALNGGVMIKSTPLRLCEIIVPIPETVAVAFSALGVNIK
jgi:hypothetical protein